MKRIGAVLLFVLLCAIISAREFRSIEEIKTSGVLRILQTEDYWYPFYYLDTDGNLSGIDIELGRHIASQLDVEAEFIRTASGHETLAENLRSGEGDIILSYYSYSPRRAAQISLSRAYITERLSVLVDTQLFEEIKKNDPEMSVEAAFKTLNSPMVSIMTVGDTVYESLADPRQLDLFTISIVVLPFNILPAQVFFFLLPWMYTGRRLVTLAMVTNDFAAVQFFRK